MNHSLAVEPVIMGLFFLSQRLLLHRRCHLSVRQTLVIVELLLGHNLLLRQNHGLVLLRRIRALIRIIQIWRYRLRNPSFDIFISLISHITLLLLHHLGLLEG